MEMVEEVAEKKSPQDKYTNDQIVNSLSTEKLRKIVDILLFYNDKEKSNRNGESSIQTFEKGNNPLFKLMKKVKYAQTFGSWTLVPQTMFHVILLFS